MSVFKMSKIVLSVGAVALVSGVWCGEVWADACADKETYEGQISTIKANQTQASLEQEVLSETNRQTDAYRLALQTTKGATPQAPDPTKIRESIMASHNASAAAITSQKEIDNLQRKLDSATRECNCTNNTNSDDKNKYTWNSRGNGGTGSCDPVKMASDDLKTANKGSVECNYAEALKGTNLRGEQCQTTADTVKDLTDRSKAINDTTTAIALTAAQVSGMTPKVATAAGSQKAASTTLKGMALSKIIQGTNDTSSYITLKNTASDANDSVTQMKEAQTSAVENCNANELSTSAYNNCVAGYAGGTITSDSAVNLKGAISQTQRQADAAKSTSQSSMISGLTNMLVGAQAFKAANMATQNANNMASTPQTFALVPITGGSSNGIETLTAPAGALDPVANPNNGFTFPGSKNAGIRGGLMNSMNLPGGAASYTSAKSTVSQASAGGGGGGGGGSDSGKSSGKKGKTFGNSTDNYAMGGGLNKGGPSTLGAGSDNNALTDALSKLLGGDPNNLNKEAQRGLASVGDGKPADGAEDSVVYEQDVNLFQVIRSKYQQLSDRGAI